MTDQVRSIKDLATAARAPHLHQELGVLLVVVANEKNLAVLGAGVDGFAVPADGPNRDACGDGRSE